MNPCLLISPMVDTLYPSRLMTMSDFPQAGQWLTPDSVRHRMECSDALYEPRSNRGVLTVDFRHHIRPSMVSKHCRQTPCPCGRSLNLKDRRICKVGIVLRHSVQSLETKSITPSQVHRQILADSVFRTRCNTLRFSPPSRLIQTRETIALFKAITWQAGSMVKDKQWFRLDCLRPHKLEGCHPRAPFEHDNPLQLSPVPQAPASHASHANTSDYVQRVGRTSDQP
jgi:hypothetical protein